MKRATAPTTEHLLDALLGDLEYGQRALRVELEGIVKGKGADSKHDKGSRIAFLMARIGSVAEQVRKIEAARRSRIESLTLPMVVAFLRGDPDARAKVAREIHSMDSRGGVLG
jgi:hypothetical protein